MTIMDYVIKYMESEELKDKIIAPINQVRIYKRMFLPCELVEFNSEKITREMREK